MEEGGGVKPSQLRLGNAQTFAGNLVSFIRGMNAPGDIGGEGVGPCFLALITAKRGKEKGYRLERRMIEQTQIQGLTRARN